jgi:DNA-binding transcriptional regulator YiaG
MLSEIIDTYTLDSMDYLLTCEVRGWGLDARYAAKKIGVPYETYRGWTNGRRKPKAARPGAENRLLVEERLSKLEREVSIELTNANIAYLMALEIASRTVGGRPSNAKATYGKPAGKRTIAEALSGFLGKQINEHTVHAWLVRKSREELLRFRNKEIVESKMDEFSAYMTKIHIKYHMARELRNAYNWQYQDIAQALELDIDTVRGWIRKNRGPALAKAFCKKDVVRHEVQRHIYPGLLGELMYWTDRFRGVVLAPEKMKTLLTAKHKDVTVEFLGEMLAELRARRG